MNKNDENEIREELNEGIDETLSNLLLGVLAKFMLEDIDNHDMEVADKYISNLRRMLIDNKKKGNK
ncbi:MAG: hypothetical protein SPJ07_01670 [Bacilli bacterium]|nr:hypothetical protein [Bacilli bacterium]